MGSDLISDILSGMCLGSGALHNIRAGRGGDEGKEAEGETEGIGF